LAYTIPLPRVRLISAASDASVPDGQTLMIAGPAYYDTVKMKDKVPGLGDMPLVGGLFRHESTSQIKKNLIILVTPTLIDAAGNRLYPESK
jgi:type II secretory pathway component GspD/PulD (secretin)